MELKVCTCRRLYSVIWRTECPDVRMSCESPAFSLEDSEWCFESKVEPNDFWETDLWQIYLKKLDSLEGLRGSQITTYMEDRDGKLELIDCAKLIFLESSSLCIASHFASQILDRKRELMVDDVFTLVFIFDRPNVPLFKKSHFKARRSSKGKNWLDTSCLESLSLDLNRLLNGGLHPDIKLQCGDQTITAHRAILSARSEVFEAMLQTDMLEKRTGSVEIVDMEPTVLKEFLRYIYTGTLPELTVEVAARLYEASDKYSVNSLKERCADFLAENVTPENACGLLLLADAHSDLSLKESIAFYVVDKNIPLVSDQWTELSGRHPRLANEVLFRAYKEKCSPK